MRKGRDDMQWPMSTVVSSKGCEKQDGWVFDCFNVGRGPAAGRVLAKM